MTRGHGRRIAPRTARVLLAAPVRAVTVVDVQPDTRPSRRPAWLTDLLATSPGPAAASAWAWEHRWLDLPTRFDDVVDLALRHRLGEHELLHLVRAAARRIHFAFALGTLERFAQEALARFPDDDLLRVLARAATVERGGAAAWVELERTVREAPAEGIADHVLLTAVYLSADTPHDVLERTLALAETLAGNGDLIALYRTVSILRRLGRYDESLRAGMEVNDVIVSGAHPAGLCDHLSERVLLERHLAVELRDAAARRAQDAQQARVGRGL